MKRILFSLLFALAIFTVVAPARVHAEPLWLFKTLHPHQYKQELAIYKQAQNFREVLLKNLDEDSDIVDVCLKQHPELVSAAAPLRLEIDVVQAAYKADINNVFDPILALMFDDIEGGIYHLNQLAQDDAS